VVISLNDILADKLDKTEYRVLWLSRKQDVVYLFDMSGDGMPILQSLVYLEQSMDDGTMEILPADMRFRILQEQDIPEKDRPARDSIWLLMESLISQEPAIYDKKQRGKIVSEAADGNKAIQVKIYRNLKRYWLYGKNKNAFLPNYRNCGGKGKERDSSGEKRGRPRKYGDTVGVNVDDAMKEIFEKAIKKFYHTRSEYNFKTAYELMIKEYFTNPVELPDGTLRHEIADADKIPTLAQFRYWYSKKHDSKEKLTARKGQSKFNLKNRAILGKSDTNIIGPGAQYQIDATVGDIYLVSRFNRSNIIGRPVIYFIIDVFSRIVTGMYIGLEGPSWVGAMMALANAAADKVSYCAKYGITISEEDWPCRHIPDTILGDRGEMESKTVETLINALNIRVDNAPAFRADMKGIVEQHFKTVNTKTTVFLPGRVKPDMAERGGKDYRLDAKLDIEQFTKIMIQCVSNHNNHFLEGYERTADMIADDIEPIPINLWNWGLAHCSGQLRTVSEDAIKLCLMPADTALVTAKGIKFKGLYYLSERAVFEHWFETARAKGSYRVDISYDPRDMSQIYIRNLEGTIFEKCFLADWESKWMGKYLDEVAHQQAMDRALKSKNENRELQSNIDLNTEIEKVVADAEQMAKQTAIPSSKKERTSNIRDNRAEEKDRIRKQEAFTLGVETQMEPVPEKPQEEEISPTLAMIKRKLEERLNEK
jgi:hypothetical protein